MTALPQLQSGVPGGPLAERWHTRRAELALVGPARRRRHRVVVVGSGLAGASAAASLGELGYQVTCVFFQDSPRRAHSVAAQGGINAAKNYQNDGDSVARLFADTLKGGDFRARESNVHRLSELSLAIVDQCVAQGVPFAREYGGQLANRSFGGALVSRTFYARGQTGQQLLLGAYQALSKEVAAGSVRLLARHEMQDVIVENGRARGVVVRDLVSGQLHSEIADAVVLASGGYSNVYYRSTNARGSNATAVVRAYRRGAAFANPCFVQFHPTCLPEAGGAQSKLTLMSESLRNDGRVWVPQRGGDARAPSDVPELERDYYLERLYPRYGNLVPRDLASRAAKAICDQGRGVGPTGRGVYLDFAEACARLGTDGLRERYGNVLDMYQQITGDDPLAVPMRIYPAAHYSMGGLWVDYDLMTTLPGLFAIGEANFSDHGANRLGASALMQCLADGYFIVPYTLGGYLAGATLPALGAQADVVRATEAEAHARMAGLLAARGSRTASEVHAELGQLLWDGCGLTRSADELARTLQLVTGLRERYPAELRIGGTADALNQELERAGRVSDYLELGALMCRDALAREESCGCHLRQEYQTADGEAQRDDARFAHVAAYAYAGPEKAPHRLQEALTFEALAPRQRDYR